MSKRFKVTAEVKIDTNHDLKPGGAAQIWDGVDPTANFAGTVVAVEQLLRAPEIVEAIDALDLDDVESLAKIKAIMALSKVDP